MGDREFIEKYQQDRPDRREERKRRDHAHESDKDGPAAAAAGLRRERAIADRRVARQREERRPKQTPVAI